MTKIPDGATALAAKDAELAGALGASERFSVAWRDAERRAERAEAELAEAREELDVLRANQTAHVEVRARLTDQLAAKDAELAAAERMLELSKATTEAVLERAERAEAELATVKVSDNKWLAKWERAERSCQLKLVREEMARARLTDELAEARKALKQRDADIVEFLGRLGPRWFLEQGWFPASADTPR